MDASRDRATSMLIAISTMAKPQVVDIMVETCSGSLLLCLLQQRTAPLGDVEGSSTVPHSLCLPVLRTVECSPTMYVARYVMG